MSQHRHATGKFWVLFTLCLAGVMAIAWIAADTDHAAGVGLAADFNEQHWSIAGEMPQGLAGLGLAVVGNHLIVVGGQTGPSAPVADVRSTLLAPDGNLAAPWSSSMLPAPRGMHGTQVYEDRIYVLGGGAPDVLNSVLSASADSNGDPVGWQDRPALPARLTVAGAAILGRYVYVGGGWGADGQAHGDVYLSEIAADGGLIGWRTTTPLPAPRSNLSLTAAVGYLYAVGGSDGQSAQRTVWRARVGGDGSLGAWEPLAPLPDGRQDHAAAFYKGQLVILGGSASGQVNSTLSAAVNGDGSLSPWQVNAAVPSLPLPLDRHAAVVAAVPGCGEVLYIAGGRSNGAYQRYVYRTDCAPTPTVTPTVGQGASPTPTPTGPWANWHDEPRVVLRPGASRSVLFDFGNQAAPAAMHATLLGPVTFAQTGNQEINETLNVIGGTYPLRVTARSDAHPGDAFYLYATVGQSIAPPLIGVIGRGVFLPLTLHKYSLANQPTPSITPTVTATGWRTSTATATGTASSTPTASRTSTATSSSTSTGTPTKTPSNTITPTRTSTKTSTNSVTPTRTPTKTYTPTITPTRTSTKTHTPTITPTRTPTKTYTPTITSTPTPTPTETPGLTWVTIMQENFEGSFPGAWVLSDQGSSPYYYYWGQRTCRPYAGSYSGWGVGGRDGSSLPCGANYPDNVTAWMNYGPFSLADAVTGDMQYMVWRNTPNSNDRVFAGVSIDGSQYYGTGYYNSVSWTSDTLDFSNVYTLGNILGQPQVWVAFIFISDGSGNLPEGGYVDNITVRKQVSGAVASDAVLRTPMTASSTRRADTMNDHFIWQDGAYRSWNDWREAHDTEPDRPDAR